MGIFPYLFRFTQYSLKHYKLTQIDIKIIGATKDIWIFSSKILWMEFLFLTICFCINNKDSFEKELLFKIELEKQEVSVIITSKNCILNNNLSNLFYQILQKFLALSNGKVEITSNGELVINFPTNLN